MLRASASVRDRQLVQGRLDAIQGVAWFVRLKRAYRSSRTSPASQNGPALPAERADHGHLQAPADNLSDLPHRYSLFSDRVVPAARFALLQRKPVEMSNIENMRRRPAIESLANIRRR